MNRIILDTDTDTDTDTETLLDTNLDVGAPGSDIDDGFALALAHADPEITIDLITTVNSTQIVGIANVIG